MEEVYLHVEVGAGWLPVVCCVRARVQAGACVPARPPALAPPSPATACAAQQCLPSTPPSTPSPPLQTSNEAAIRFYQRFGFEVADTIRGYYKRLDPPDAALLRKLLLPPAPGAEGAAGGGDCGCGSREGGGSSRGCVAPVH